MPYETWFDQASSVLAKYEDRTADAASIEDDYRAVMEVAPRDVLIPIFSETFRSPAAPPLSELVASIYDPLPPESRAFLWGPLLEAAPALRRALPDLIPPVGPLSSDRAASISAKEMAGIIEEGQSLSPDLYDSFTLFFGYFSPLSFGLPAQTKIAILGVLAQRAKEAQAEAKRQREREEQQRREERERWQQQGRQEQMQQRQDVQQQEEPAGNYRYVEEVAANLIRNDATPLAGPAPSGAESAPPARFPSLQIFHDDEGNRTRELKPDEAFQANVWYQIEVSIGPEIRGIYGARGPIREPNQKENVDILVTAHGEAFDIAEPIGTIVLPPQGQSIANAEFRIRPRQASSSSGDWQRIEFRLFYQFNLLEVFSVKAVVCSAETNAPGPGDEKPIVFDQQRQMDAQDFDLIAPRALHIYVEAKDTQYRLTFTIKRGEDKLSLPPVDLLLNAGDLEDRIAGLRKRLFAVCSSDILGAKVAGDPDEFADQLKTLAEEGSNIWSLLFDGGGSMSELGHWLRANPLPPDSAIQVSIDPSAFHFVLAWGVLYDRWAPDTPAILEGFWGMRYVVEQRPIAICTAAAGTPALKEIGAMFWKFDQTQSQVAYLSDLLGQTSVPKVILNGPIDSASAALACLGACSSDLVYFYTHGYTSLPNAERYGFSVQDFARVYSKFPPETKKALRYIYDDIQNRQFDSDRSFIELSSGRILLDDLYKRMSKFSQRPIVLLNMCDSAQVIPSLSRSFIQFFLSRQARAVLGTECPIRPVFADFVARALVRLLLAGVPIGQALLNIRRDAAAQNNLLGLAYTLFGSAEAGFLPVLPM